MKKLKKISLIILASLLLCVGVSTKSVAVISCAVSISGDTTVKSGDKFTVIVGISNLQTSRGIIAIDATLEYDTNKLTYVSMTNTGSWSTPSYNASNGKLVADRSDFGKTSESVFRITFQAKDGASGDAYIKLNDITIADGDEEGSASNASKTITITANNSGNSNKDTNITGTTNKGNTNKNVNQINNNEIPEEENVTGEIEENTNIDENINNVSEPDEIKEETVIEPEIKEKKFEMKYVYFGVGAVVILGILGGLTYIVISGKKGRHGKKQKTEHEKVDRINIEKIDK